MKYSAPILASLAVVGSAYDATISSKDKLGNTLASQTVSYEMGQQFSVELPLGVNYDGPYTISLASTTYAPKNCHLYMGGKEQMGKLDKLFGMPKPEPAWIGGFDELCDWPGVQITEAGKKVSGYEITMNVSEIPQFYGRKMLEIECETDDVTLYSQVADLKCGSEAMTVQN
jgi:hypothetical protein